MSHKLDFERPIVTIIEALRSKHRRHILIDLREFNCLSYSEILQRTNLQKGTLNYHLKKLISAGIVRNFLVDQQVTPYTSYYEVSELGIKIVEGLLSAFRPPAYRMQIFTSTAVNIQVPPGIDQEELQRAIDATNPPFYPRERRFGKELIISELQTR